MENNFKDWTQLKLTVSKDDLDTATAIMGMIDLNLQVEDYSDIDLSTCYGDLIDESILNADKTIASVSVYIPAERSTTDAIAFIRDRLAAEKLDGKIEVVGVNEEDWATSWKAFYHTTRIGKSMVIVPMWEEYEEQPGDVIIKMDPGMAFGTGTHETTRLVIELLERYTTPGCRMLDVGCGSGILAICASKLGAGICRAYDIDPVAVRVANENIEASGETNISCAQSDLLRHVDLSDGQYDVITANIVSDIIIRMAPDVAAYMKDDATLLASGIIIERAEEVVSALEANGLKVVDRLVDNGWCALVVKK
ncbi:MAG: 50S ribosomal protein L11 methyltransferase [Clostridia bacterium]|nr:50S ribosomal protein L11 methyltransferase [Clostridia bacterium]